MKSYIKQHRILHLSRIADQVKNGLYWICNLTAGFYALLCIISYSEFLQHTLSPSEGFIDGFYNFIDNLLSRL